MFAPRLDEVIRYLAVILLLLTACVAPVTTQESTILNVQATGSTEAWISTLYNCAGNIDRVISIEFRNADYLESTSQLLIRMGEPSPLSNPAYLIGSDELVIVVHRENPVPSLSSAELRGLFTGTIRNWKDAGGIDIPVEVWVLEDSDDLREFFDDAIMQGQLVTSHALLAVDLETLISSVSTIQGAIGFLPRSLVESELRIVPIDKLVTPLTIPVLAIPSADADQEIMDIIACMQQ